MGRKKKECRSIGRLFCVFLLVSVLVVNTLRLLRDVATEMRLRREDKDDGDFRFPSKTQKPNNNNNDEDNSGSRPHIHVLTTSNGSPYLNWQARIMYRTYLDVLEGGGSGDLMYFTRLLHRRIDDELMREVPTVRVDSLHAECDKWCQFPVHDRPSAIRDWLNSPDSKRGGETNKFVLLLETDYVWKRPLRIPVSLLRGDAEAVAFHFHYINPHYPTLPPVMTRLMKTFHDVDKVVDTKNILASGPAPTLIRVQSLNKLIDDYVKITEEIELDNDAKEKLGWVREMYAYSIAAVTSKVKHIVEDGRKTILISQPPADDDLYDAAMYHYTWGARYVSPNKSIIWDWDKRSYIDVKHVREPAKHMPSMPPNLDDYDETEYASWKLLDGKPVTKKINSVLRDLIGTMRSAIERLEAFPNPNCGWLESEPRCDKFNCQTGVLCEI